MNVSLDQLLEVLNNIRREVGKVIIGQEEVIDRALIAVFTNQHALIEGVPGVAKTLLVRTLAKVLGSSFSRIQFTPDLMPADITGTHVFNMQKGTYNLIRGPIFTQFLLADEINRAPAKTQSALLQAMQERKVTIDRSTLLLPDNFTVFATQNPVEYEGTYPLPEAQRDRFMLKIVMDLPDRDTELTLAQRMLVQSESPEKVLERGAVERVVTAEELSQLRLILEKVLIKEELIQYVVDLVRRTREHDSVMVGAGPRATQALIWGVRAAAAIAERDFVTPDDIKALAGAVLDHRIILRPEFEIEGVTVQEVLQQILQELPLPK